MRLYTTVLYDLEYILYSIHQFFSQYYTALGSAQALALGEVGKIISTVSPPKDSSLDLKWLSILISASFSAFGIGKEFLTARTFKVIFIGMSAVAGGDSQMAAKLSEVVQNYQGGIADMISTIQGDPVKFLQLCSAGGFSQAIPASLPDQQKIILGQLKLYILSMSLRLSGNVISARYVCLSTSVDAVRAGELEIVPAQLKCSCTLHDVAKTTNKVKCPGFDNYSTCNQWWYDSSTDTTYALTSLTGDGRDSLSHLTHAIFDNGWATPQTLFTADPSCSLANPSLDDNMNVQCLSSVQKCTAANVAWKSRVAKVTQ
ncbi:hypothetical protein BDD12DRAFT_882188 [Trichophaea hybrida]|nr:hypothetical protein BDD12DRAFT_882188 [Trichophaea hybrida]